MRKNGVSPSFIFTEEVRKFFNKRSFQSLLASLFPLRVISWKDSKQQIRTDLISTGNCKDMRIEHHTPLWQVAGSCCRTS